MTQVDRVWSKSESVVLPNFMLKVVAESPLTIGVKAKSYFENPTKEAVFEAGSVEQIQVSFRLLLLPCTCQHHIHACMRVCAQPQSSFLPPGSVQFNPTPQQHTDLVALAD